MDAGSAAARSPDAIVMDGCATDARGTQGVCPRDIPAVSLCPPDSVCLTEASLTAIQSEAGLCDSCSSLGVPSSPCQLYHQMSRAGITDLPQHGRGQRQEPFKANMYRDCRSDRAGPCAEHSVRDVRQGCGSAHEAPRHGAVRCHWLHGSHETHKSTQQHVVSVRDGGLYCVIQSYTHVIVEHPRAVLLSCTLLLLSCSLAGILIGPLPDFSDPLLGFEPRGTYIAVRQSSLSKLRENTGPGKMLSPLPQQPRGAVSGDGGQVSPRLRARRMLAKDSSADTFLCDTPGEHLAQLVFRSENSASLWSLKSIHAMCEMEQARIRSQAQFQELCQQHMRVEAEEMVSRGGCCPSWSLGNYLAVLTNASCCLSLTSQQVSESLSLLRFCAPFYHEGHLVETCMDRPKYSSCSSVPSRCKQSRVVFHILHFLVDKDFLSPQTVEYQIPTLKYSLLFLPLDKGKHMVTIYKNSLQQGDLTYHNTTITGMDFGIKQMLFKYYLARDSVYPVLAVVSLLLTMVMYLHSLFSVALSVIAITGSLLTAYFFYKVVFRLTFFPMVNFSAALILLGSCSNQVFTFADFWKLQLSQNPSAPLEKRVNRALREVGYLIVASGLTSSAAFFCGYLSSITAIRCFSVYLGTASFISSLLALVWLPCSFVLCERHSVASSGSAAVRRWKPCCPKKTRSFWQTSSRKRCLFTLGQKLRELKRGLTDTSDLLFLKILPCGVVKFRYIWVCWFAVLAAGGTYMSCFDPGMTLPNLDSRVSQLFRSSHPFERYDAEYRHMFMFERQREGEDKPVTLTLVWGVTPTDNGDHLNPRSNGTLILDPDFNMSRPASQMWLRDLCGRVQNQSFYSLAPPEDKDITDICLVEQLVQWVSVRRCSDTDEAPSVCCNNVSFPYPPMVFENCLSMMLAERYAQGHLAHRGGLYFQSDGQIAALVLAIRTTYLYSLNFSRTNLFFREVLTWFNTEMAGAPAGLQNGWFTSQLSLFDLQQTLSSETLVVAGLSVALTFSLLLLTTWNLSLSLYGTAAVGGSVFVTVGLLVLLEWQLSGIEALFISLAAGLSVDFISNYCISYSLAPHSDRIGKVAHSTKRMGCPVAIGAGAFFCMGIIMLPATTLLFRKLGIFLFLVKCVACGFATFFFQSLCCFFGPQNKCGKSILPCLSDQTDMLMSCQAAEPSCSSASAANGAFGKLRVRRSYDRDVGGYLYPNHQRQQRQKQIEGGVGGGRGPEQYELQPLAYRLSDSFENSTCTSKLSNRPSVLSDEIEYCGRDIVGNSLEVDSEETECTHGHNICQQTPALQTSSPYKRNAHQPGGLQADLDQSRLLCKACRGQTCGVKNWPDPSFSSSSSMEETMISHAMETTDHPNLHKEEDIAEEMFQSQHRSHTAFRSFQSQSSCEGLEDSNETCLSEIEPGPSSTLQQEEDRDAPLQPGHLNGKRDTLRLSLKETYYDNCGRGNTSQGEEVVILPNSKPDLPDVWIKRDGRREDTC